MEEEICKTALKNIHGISGLLLNNIDNNVVSVNDLRDAVRRFRFLTNTIENCCQFKEPQQPEKIKV